MDSAKCLALWLIVLGLFGGMFAVLPVQAQGLVGGPCRYVDYPGRATIVTVNPETPAMDVTFTFAPDRPIAGDPLYEPGKVHHLTLIGGSAPGPRFVERYGLRPGLTLPCLLRTIRQGTCTPVLFDFPGLDLTQKPE
ncbi:MAG: hypothetical protein AB7U59_05670 [Desulfovibrionaceae bacterium]|jgi:hypothetical protein